MPKKQQDEPKVTIEGKEYKVSDFNQEQLQIVNHVADLENKLRSATFNVVQLTGGRDYFMGKLKENLSEK